MAIDAYDLLVARVSLELQLHPSSDIADTIDHDLGVFLGNTVFERLSVEDSLRVLAREDDSVAVNLLRADAILDVYAAQREGLNLTDELSDALTQTANALLPGPDDSGRTADLLSRLREASALPTREERWSLLEKTAKGLLPDILFAAPHGSCVGEKVPYGKVPNEYAAQITTETTVAYDGRTFDDIAKNLVPERWPECNGFFCSMTFRGDLAVYFPGALLVDLQSTDADWRGVYEEKVGTCPNGSLKNVFLGTVWLRRPDALALTYDLVNVPGLPADVELDRGFVSVTAGAGGFVIKTLKLLRFSPASGYSDGHSLGLIACAMGWLDIIVHMIVCDQTVSDSSPSPSPSPTPSDAAPVDGTPPVEYPAIAPGVDLSDCAKHARNRVDHYANEFDKAIKACTSSDSPSTDATSLAAGLGIQIMGDVAVGAVKAFGALRTAVDGGPQGGASGEP